MKRLTAVLFVVVISVLLLSEPASANEPPAPQTMLAEIIIVPLAFALFTFSGAAALHDRQKSESLKKAGKLKRHSLRRGRLKILGIVTLACLLAAVHEGLALLLSIVLGVYAIVIAIRMIRVGQEAPPGSYSRWTPRVAGGLLIPFAVFLASFSVAFFSSSDTYRYQEHFDLRTLEDFWECQQEHAESHGGVYFRLPFDESDGADPQQRYLSERLSHMLDDSRRSGSARCSISYRDDMRGYEIKTTPVGFLPWPYRWFTSRKAYYIDQSGVIRCETMTSPGKDASSKSRVIKTLAPQPSAGNVPGLGR